MKSPFSTLDDFDLADKTVFLRVDMNCPIGNGRIRGQKRIEEATLSLHSLANSKVVMATHQGRVGNDEYIELAEHAEILERLTGRTTKYLRDVSGDYAQQSIKNMKNGDIILLDNLRLCAEENHDFAKLADTADTMMIRRLSPLFDICVLDAFSCAHRKHPSITGFAQLMPTCAGRLVESEMKNLSKVETVIKSPHIVVLGGSKIRDRLQAIKLLIKHGRADQILLTGLIGNVFLRAQGRLKLPLKIRDEQKMVASAHKLIGEYPDVFTTPVDVAIDKDGQQRVEMDVRDVSTTLSHNNNNTKTGNICDIGRQTVEHYTRIINGAGTVLISGPAGKFEDANFNFGTNSLLRAVSNSMATTIVSGGHLSTALDNLGLTDKVNHQSTAGGALVMYLAGEKMPMIDALVLNHQKFKI